MSAQILLARRREMMSRKLPYDSKIEYLEGVQGAYIKSGIIINANNWNKMRIEFDGTFNNTINSGWKCHGIGYANPTFYVALSDNGYLAYGKGIMGDMRTNRVLTQQEYTTRHKYIVDYVQGKVFFDDETFTMTLPTNSALNHEFYIFTWNSSGYTSQNYCVGGKVYSFSLYENDIPIRDFIPVRIGQIGYLYDRVSKQLFANQGTGDFILGPDI